ncbi:MULTISPECIES: MBL fold metallo-hydrolase [unclassified Tardiphaga]|uniref:MBL fold metallo-hydrolase n=1 Tax=unclassified Tardiphaga TaxID=2631404 RepID=UPI00143D2C26|nr:MULTISPECIES: MBL fold metallo-hydrolase [unclassified Tardiphaga]
MKVDLLIAGLPAKADHFLFGICSLLLLRGAGRTMLFDTGPFRVRPMLVAALASHGLTPRDIDTVFLTHLHWDHVENIDLFAHAEIITPRLEYEYAVAPRVNDWGTPPYVREMLHGMNMTLLPDEEQQLFPGVHTLLLPGHSVGLQGLAIESGEDRLVLASDALWSARDATRGVPDVAFFDPAKAQRSLDRALAAGNVFYPGHDRAFRFENQQVTYLSQYNYALSFAFQPHGQDFDIAISTERHCSGLGGAI